MKRYHLHLIPCQQVMFPPELNLSGNNFFSLPECISQLSRLKILNLDGCKRLQSLETVPSTVAFVSANYCTSLVRLPELQNDPFRSYHTELCFKCLNCFKLVDNIQSDNNMLQGQSGKLPNRLDIIISGSEIPIWFSEESMGRKVSIIVPSYQIHELMGIALCVVFVPNKCHQHPRDCQLSCSFELNGCKMESLDTKLKEDYGKIELHRLWLLYLSYPYFDPISEKILNGQLEIEISTRSLEVKKVGVHLVYEQDIEDPNQTMAQCNNYNMFNGDLGVLHHDLDNLATKSTRNKRSRDEDDGAGPIGEGYSKKESQPKRIQREFFDFFTYQMSKKLEVYRGSRRDSYQSDVEELAKEGCLTPTWALAKVNHC